MSEPMALILTTAMGGTLGVFFFGGLWWTTRRGLTSPTPAAWFFGSLLLRTGITAFGFVMISRGHSERVIACLLGFIIARLAVTRLTRLPGESSAGSAKGTGHAH